jgi:uncharacterized membrane protein
MRYFIIIFLAFMSLDMIGTAYSSSGNSSYIPMSDKHNSEIIIDTESFPPLKLNDSYELAIKSVDIDGNKVYLELAKDGQIVDSKVIIAANGVDDTLVYSKPGTSQLIKVHVKNAFRGADGNLVTVDGILQTSETDPRLVLTNNTDLSIITSGTALILEDGYELAIKSVDIDGNKVYLELAKDGQAVDSKVIIPANKVDDTLVYSKPGTSQLIKVHIKNSFRGRDANLVTVDGVLQTSETDPSLVLINNNDSSAITSGTTLILEDGYELAIKSVDIDGNKVYLELAKDGQVVDSKVIIPANKVDDTFVYSNSSISQSITVHIKNAYRGASANLATVDEISQV